MFIEVYDGEKDQKVFINTENIIYIETEPKLVHCLYMYYCVEMIKSRVYVNYDSYKKLLDVITK